MGLQECSTTEIASSVGAHKQPEDIVITKTGPTKLSFCLEPLQSLKQLNIRKVHHYFKSLKSLLPLLRGVAQTSQREYASGSFANNPLWTQYFRVAQGLREANNLPFFYSHLICESLCSVYISQSSPLMLSTFISSLSSFHNMSAYFGDTWKLANLPS